MITGDTAVECGGHAAAVRVVRSDFVVDVAETAELIEQELELLRDICTAMKQVESGEVLSNREAKAELRRRFRG